LAQEVLKCETVRLELADLRFYHRDLCLQYLPGNNRRGESDRILWYPPAFSSGSQQLLRAWADSLHIELQAVDELNADPARYAALNGEAIVAPDGTRHYVVNGCSEDFARMLKEWGWQVEQCPTPEFLAVYGAGPACLILPLVG